METNGRHTQLSLSDEELRCVNVLLNLPVGQVQLNKPDGQPDHAAQESFEKTLPHVKWRVIELAKSREQQLAEERNATASEPN